MSERILKVMSGNLGISCGSGCEEHKHCIVTACIICGLFEFLGKSFQFFIKIMPSFSYKAVNANLNLQIRASLGCKFSLIGNIACTRTNNCLAVSRIESVFKIMILQKMCCRDNDCSEFMKCKDCKPELIMSLKYYENFISLADTKRLKIICSLVWIIGHIFKCKSSGFL